MASQMLELTLSADTDKGTGINFFNDSRRMALQLKLKQLSYLKKLKREPDFTLEKPRPGDYRELVLFGTEAKKARLDED